MITIAEHTIEETLLPLSGNVLDLGCRGFLFTDELRRLGHNVKPVDCDLIEGYYYQMAIAAYDGYATLIKNNDPQAVHIKASQEISKQHNNIKCLTLKSFSKLVGIEFWDVIKIDIEGAEYEVIMSLTEPPAKQLSIEFHLHTGIYGIQDVRKMEVKLHNLGYEFASHEMTSQHGMGMNYWDSLFILK